MKVMSIDPGALRAGWAVLTKDPDLEYVDSGVYWCRRGETEAFQKYRMRLAGEWQEASTSLLEYFEPDHLINETVPSRGAPINEQLYLANVMLSTLHATALRLGIPITQVSARTVQKAIAIRGNSKGVTKPQVRNGVLSHIPQLKSRAKEFVKIFEETDALAIGLWFLGEQ